jgi:predicted HicB family RNase H-like nuclease
MKLPEYKGYTATVEQQEDGIWYGKLDLLTDVITVSGFTTEEVTQDFKDAVEDYLESCKVQDKEPEKLL